MSRSASVKYRDTKSLTNLGHVLKRWRLIDDLSIRDAAATLGIGHATLFRLEMGHKPDADTFLHVMNWLYDRRKP